MGFADLHIHSVYSDGTFTPEKIVREARARNVSLISVCDHNVLEGTLETVRLAKGAGIKCIGGVEIDSIFHGRDLHILCYGADPCAEPLRSDIRSARAALDEMSVFLLRRMCGDGFKLDEIEYAEFPHDTAVGGWKMLQYLKYKGITHDLRDAFQFYERYNVSYVDAGFDLTEKVIADIHAAGGRAVLAHPGVSISHDNITEFEHELNSVLEIGADGIECFYPRHGKGIEQTCLRICRNAGKMVTAGSDCHGAFNKNEIGCTRTAESELELKGLEI